MLKKVMKIKRFNEEVYTGSPKVNLSCFREFDELERSTKPLKANGKAKWCIEYELTLGSKWAAETNQHDLPRDLALHLSPAAQQPLQCSARCKMNINLARDRSVVMAGSVRLASGDLVCRPPYFHHNKMAWLIESLTFVTLGTLILQNCCFDEP